MPGVHQGGPRLLLIVVGAAGLGLGCPTAPTECSAEGDPACTADEQCDVTQGHCVSLLCTESRTCPRQPQVMECNLEEGRCIPVNPDYGQPCTGDEQCGDHGVCVDDFCAIAPTCQSLYGDFRIYADCTGAPRRALAVAHTTNCFVELEGTAGGAAFSFGYSTIPANAPATQLGLALSGCTGSGTWSAAESAGVMQGCTIGGESCTVVVVSERHGAEPCSGPGTCVTGTCEPFDTLSGPEGLCR